VTLGFSQSKAHYAPDFNTALKGNTVQLRILTNLNCLQRFADGDENVVPPLKGLSLFISKLTQGLRAWAQ
jgi:hypothetical protein